MTDIGLSLQGTGRPLHSIDWKRLRKLAGARLRITTGRVTRVKARITQAQTTILTVNGFLFGTLSLWHTFGTGAGLAGVAASSFGLVITKDD